VFAAEPGACTGVLEHRLEIAADRSYPWKQAEDQSRDHGDENGPAQRLAVDTKRVEKREGQRSLVREPRYQRQGKSEPKYGTRHREHKAFH
jgi:hypothetical protein